MLQNSQKEYPYCHPILLSLLYADYIVILLESEAGLQMGLDILNSKRLL